MKILCLEPDFDTATHWWWHWVRSLVAEPAKEAGYEVIELYASQDVLAQFRPAMQESVWLAGVGHGNASTFTGHNTEVLLSTTREEDGVLMAGRFYGPVSCQTGASLAPWLVQKGGKGAFGYTQNYWFVIEPENWPDGLCKFFAESHHTLDRAMLLDGKTNSGAAAATLAAYDAAIVQAPEGVRPYLLSDRNCFVWYGDPNAKVKEEPEPKPQYCPLGMYMPNKDPEDKEAMVSIFENGCYGIVDKWHLLGYVRQQCPNGVILMRPYFENGMANDPEQIANWACDFLADKISQSKHVVIGNELNLESPGFDPNSVEDWKKLDDWVYRTIKVMRARLPEAIIHWPAISPGVGDDPNVPPTGMRYCERSINAADVLNCHVYWPAGLHESIWHGRRYEMVHKLFPHKYIFIDECGPGELRRDDAAEEIVQWARKVYSVDYAIGFTFFMWNWSVDQLNYYNKPKILDAFRALERPLRELPDDWIYDGDGNGPTPDYGRAGNYYRNWAYNNCPWGPLPYNPDAAFPRKAREVGLGHPVAPEDRWIDSDGVRWAGQRFTHCLLYCVEGDWQNIKVAKY